MLVPRRCTLNQVMIINYNEEDKAEKLLRHTVIHNVFLKKWGVDEELGEKVRTKNLKCLLWLLLKKESLRPVINLDKMSSSYT